jgi:signal transduction histidine kinase
MAMVEARRLPAQGVGAAIAVVTAVTLVVYPLQVLDPGVSSGVLYVLGVLLVSVRWGLALGLFTSVASAAALFYFHTSPAGLHSKTADDLVAIATLLITSAVATAIADKARLRAEEAEERLRLEEELRRRESERIRLEELRASRARVIGAADEERRRVVRDLHDGAQQRLVHTVVTLKLLRRAVRSGETDVTALVGEALEHAERATAELRELAHGILPSVLTRGGLRAGVEALASRIAVPVRIGVSVDRLPGVVEATAYFVVAEALTNVAKHSGANRAEVTARVEDGALRLDVRDDGVGGAQPAGNGLLGLGDRLAALDGRLEIASPANGGTVVAAAIPIPG